MNPSALLFAILASTQSVRADTPGHRLILPEALNAGAGLVQRNTANVKEFQKADVVPDSQSETDDPLDPLTVEEEDSELAPSKEVKNKKGSVVVDDYDPNNMGSADKDAKKKKASKSEKVVDKTDKANKVDPVLENKGEAGPVNEKAGKGKKSKASDADKVADKVVDKAEKGVKAVDGEKANKAVTTTKTATSPDSPTATPDSSSIDREEEALEGAKLKSAAREAGSQEGKESHHSNYETGSSLFVGALVMIVVSEIGDKTFFIAALMAMRHPPVYVFTSSYAAMVFMTVLSMVIGLFLPSLLSKNLSTLLATILFLVFGLKLLKEGWQMDKSVRATEELEEVEQEIAMKDGNAASEKAEGGGVYQRRNLRVRPWRKFQHFVQDIYNSPWVQIFVMTFFGEWGDRSQIATVAMGSGSSWTAVCLGCLAGHFITSVIAVMGGHILASKLSLRTITLGGAFCFLLFAVAYFKEWLSL